MGTFDYVVATDFDRAWLNFELDLPLKPDKDGRPNAFYIDRPGNPISELTDALSAPSIARPSSSSQDTWLWQVHGAPPSDGQYRIQEEYWPINFSIRDEADIIDIDFRDVLLAIGSRLFREYRKRGGKLPDQLLKELHNWKGKVEKEVSTILDGRVANVELGASIDAFFASAGLKMKLEPATRWCCASCETDITGQSRSSITSPPLSRLSG
jgi:hypothetical protein